MKTIIGTDGSAYANLAVDLAASLPWPERAALRVVCALDPMAFYGPFTGFAPVGNGVGDDLEAALDDIAADAAQRLQGDGRSIDDRVIVGRPSNVLRDEASSFGADLIIVGSRGRSPIATLLLGSTSAEVIDHAPCPVLVARKDRVTRILLAHDGSADASHAERVVSEWPVFSGARMDVVGVVGQTASLPADVVDSVAGMAAQRLEGHGRTVQPHIVVGDPAYEITRTAEELGADLIVVGTRGNTGLKRLLLGSVARNVLTHAHASVLVVPPVEATAS